MKINKRLTVLTVTVFLLIAAAGLLFFLKGGSGSETSNVGNTGQPLPVVTEKDSVLSQDEERGLLKMKGKE